MKSKILLTLELIVLVIFTSTLAMTLTGVIEMDKTTYYIYSVGMVVWSLDCVVKRYLKILTTKEKESRVSGSRASDRGG